MNFIGLLESELFFSVKVPDPDRNKKPRTRGGQLDRLQPCAAPLGLPVTKPRQLPASLLPRTVAFHECSRARTRAAAAPSTSPELWSENAVSLSTGEGSRARLRAPTGYIRRCPVSPAEAHTLSLARTGSYMHTTLASYAQDLAMPAAALDLLPDKAHQPSMAPSLHAWDSPNGAPTPMPKR